MKKKVLKTVGLGLLLIVTAVGIFVGVKLATANFVYAETPFPTMAASDDPEVIARGEYVVHHLGHCSTCHTQTDGKLDLSTWKLDKSVPLSGGYKMEAGPFGTYYAKNLTPHPETGIGRYSDKELARMIRHGIDKNGQLMPLMVLATGHLSDEDLVAVISYLRTRPAVDNAVPADEFGPLAKMLASSFGPRMQTPPRFVPAAAEPSVERGEYLANGPAACGVCHTPTDPMEGFAPAGPAFSGAVEGEPDPTDPSFGFFAPNLTPHESGLTGMWDEEQFVKRLKSGARVHVGSHMPWESYAGMTDSDVRSVYRYLKTVKPADNPVGETRRKL